MKQHEIQEILRDVVTRRLLDAATLLRLAYTGPDGAPRAIPVAYLFDGTIFEIFTIVDSDKVAALRRDPRVAFTIDTEDQPPTCLLGRGTAAISIEDGVPDGFLRASTRRLSPAQATQFEAQVRVLYDQMARITITPTWVRLLDFQRTAPRAVERLAAQRGLAG